MMDFASAHARAKGLAPTASCEERHIEAIAARLPKASPTPTADGVDKMYHQLADIHALAIAQLVECVHWHRSNLPLMRLTLAWIGEDPLWSPL
jgi:hypothetical protein